LCDVYPAQPFLATEMFELEFRSESLTWS